MEVRARGGELGRCSNRVNCQSGQSSKGYQKAPSWFCPVGVKEVGSLRVTVVRVLYRSLNVRMELLFSAYMARTAKSDKCNLLLFLVGEIIRLVKSASKRVILVLRSFGLLGQQEHLDRSTSPCAHPLRCVCCRSSQPKT